MGKNLKKILLVAFISALSVAQFSTICQAKLKPGQFNKEMLRWIEPYKDRDNVPDSWTWYPEYDLNDRYGILPKGAVITNEDDCENDLFYDHYWDNRVWRGGFNRVNHSKSVGRTTALLASVSTSLFGSRGKHHSISPVFDSTGKKFKRRAESKLRDCVRRQVSKDVELYTGKSNVCLISEITISEGEILDIDVFLVFNKNGNITSGYNITDEYILEFENFKYDNLEKALDRFSKVCYNYDAYIGGGEFDGHPSFRRNFENQVFLGEQEDVRKFCSKKVLDLESRLGDSLEFGHLTSMEILGLLEKYLEEEVK